MALDKAHPVRFTPKGLSDAYDSTDAFQGACRSLSNLVFDQQNPELLVCRPGAVRLTSFGTFTTPTFVSIQQTIGTVCYGMVSTGRNAGKDEPFAFDLLAGTFITISGVTGANTPSSPAPTGSWNPPSMTVVGKRIIITHPGFSGTGTNFYGVIDVTNPAAPAWSSHNLATNALPSVPTWVANLNNRAYFVCGNVLYYSDVLDPLTATNAGQSLTLGDTTPIRALNGLPIQTTSSGVQQALVAFKDTQVWQITGDSALSTLSLNYMSLVVGTAAPRSVVQTPYGVYFMAVDGPYIVDPLGMIRPLTKQPGSTEQDIQTPFIYAVEPSRVAAGFAFGVYRICLQTTSSGLNTTSDYWFDTQRRRWNGPHTFPSDCVSQYGNVSIISHYSKGAALFRSQLVNTSTSVYADDGAAIYFNLESSTFPKDMTMTQKMVVESTIELGVNAGLVTYGVTAYDERRGVINSAPINVENQVALWGFSTWGGTVWNTGQNIPQVYTVPWTVPLVFQKMALFVDGISKSNITIGTFFARYQLTGYMNRN